MRKSRNPFETMEEFFDRMSDQFEDAADAWDRGETFDRWGSGRESMAIDVRERPEEFVVTVDVPGFETDDIELEILGDDVLSIEAEREEEMEAEDEEFVHRERSRRSLDRRFTLPAPVLPEDVTATVEKGVLTVTLPKAEPRPEGTRIEVSGQ